MKGLKGLRAARKFRLQPAVRGVVCRAYRNECLVLERLLLSPGLCESLDGYLFYQANSIFKVCQKPSLVFGLGSVKPLQRKPGWTSNSICARGTQRHLFQMCVWRLHTVTGGNRQGPGVSSSDRAELTCPTHCCIEILAKSSSSWVMAVKG